MSVPSLIVTPLFRSFSATFTSSSPELAFPPRGDVEEVIGLLGPVREEDPVLRGVHPSRPLARLDRDPLGGEVFPLRGRDRGGIDLAGDEVGKVGTQVGGGELLGDDDDIGALLHFPGGLRGRDACRAASEHKAGQEEKPAGPELWRGAGGGVAGRRCAPAGGGAGGAERRGGGWGGEEMPGSPVRGKAASLSE